MRTFCTGCSSSQQARRHARCRVRADAELVLPVGVAPHLHQPQPFQAPKAVGHLLSTLGSAERERGRGPLELRHGRPRTPLHVRAGAFVLPIVVFVLAPASAGRLRGPGSCVRCW
jgi:hypothetical protein